MTVVTQAQASSMIKAWDAPAVASVYDVDVEGDPFTLIYPEATFEISATFFAVKGHPEWTRVRCVNWRAEDEPNGVYRRGDAAKFYLRLLNAGFVKHRQE